MKIGMIGMGKLGLPVALAIESCGHEVCGYDKKPAAYTYIAQHKIPYTEAGLQPLLDNTDIRMYNNPGDVVANSDIVFIAVQTPHEPEYEGATLLPNTRKDFDYTHLKEAIAEVAACALQQQKKTILAVISTCLPETYGREIKPLLNEYIEYVYTPQFIAMGTVLDDYLDPEFNLIGVDSYVAANTLQTFYESINPAPPLRTTITTAEGIKVSYNTFITMKTVLANTWGELSHLLGMNADDIYHAWSLSTKRLLAPKYLKAGVGDGGGCHPRDNIALSYLAQRVGLSHNLFEDLMRQRQDHMGFIAGLAKREAIEKSLPIVILGRSFKPETNIETGSPAILLANILHDSWGGNIQHVEDLDDLTPAVYVIGTQHLRYKKYKFPAGSVVVDPFRYIKNQRDVKVVGIGKL